MLPGACLAGLWGVPRAPSVSATTPGVAAPPRPAGNRLLERFGQQNQGYFWRMGFLTNSKIKWYAGLVLAAFALGLVETLFSDDERTEQEYAFIQEAIRTNDSLTTKYGQPRDFSRYPSRRQYVDSSAYAFSVEYEHKDVHLECRLLKGKGNSVKIQSLSEFKGNMEVIREKFF